MASLKEIRNRIISVSNTCQVTGAMKMVSASKLGKAQDTISKIKPYAETMQKIISTVSSSISEKFTSPLFTKNTSDKVLLILITSNKGLCGAYNSNISRFALDWINTNSNTVLENKEVEFICIGRKGYEIVSKAGKKVTHRNDELSNKPLFDNSAQFVENIINRFQNNDFSEVFLFYNSFKTAATQKATVEKMLPVPIYKAKESKLLTDFILEPNPDRIIKDLTPKMIKIQFHKAILDAVASEHGARMTAMHQATDNATELVGTLKLNYNKARQDNITNELLEIVSGANALKG